VADEDTNALYNTSMGSGLGGIDRIGSPGSFSYSAIAGRENMPVNYVSFWDSTRFANWLHNGQPTGTQDDTTTEDGAYTLTPTDIANNTVSRNLSAVIFVASENEWYKAAYYDPLAMSYFEYPAGSDTPPTCSVPGAGPNTANCSNAQGDLSEAGSYTGAASPSGTFDQGGNVWEWNDTIVGASRILRGGSLIDSPAILKSSNRTSVGPSTELDRVGFRVVTTVPPAPFPDGIPALNPLGLLVVATGLLGFGVYRRGRQ